MDGTDRKILVSLTSPSWPNGLTIDRAGKLNIHLRDIYITKYINNTLIIMLLFIHAYAYYINTIFCLSFHFITAR